MNTDAENCPENWETLPTLALVNIQSYLDPKNSISAGLVSQSWNFAYNDPKLWKSIKHTFTGIRQSDNDAIIHCRLHPTHLRNLTFSFECGPDCSRGQHGGKLDRAKCSKAIEHAVMCFNWLNRRNSSSVREVRIDFPRADYFPNLQTGLRTKFRNALSEFLSNQVNLVVLEMIGLALPFTYGLKIFIQVIKTNPHLSNVALDDFFPLHKSAIFWEKFGNALASIKNLKNLHVTMDCLTDRVMEILAKDAPKNVLQHWTIRVYQKHTINVLDGTLTKKSQKHWQMLRKKIPGLILDMKPDVDVNTPAMFEIFLRPMQLVFTKKCVITFPKNVSTDSVKKFLIMNEHPMIILQQIESLEFKCDFGNPATPLIVSFVDQCPNLKHVSFTGTGGNDVIDHVVTDKLNQWVTETPGRSIAIDNKPAALSVFLKEENLQQPQLYLLAYDKSLN